MRYLILLMLVALAVLPGCARVMALLPTATPYPTYTPVVTKFTEREVRLLWASCYERLMSRSSGRDPQALREFQSLRVEADKWSVRPLDAGRWLIGVQFVFDERDLQFHEIGVSKGAPCP